jgi:hypothetical protein
MYNNLTKTQSRDYFIEKWRKYLANESESKQKMNSPFRVLTNLYGHKYNIKELESLRLNPNLMNTKNIRNDLEFYIPQLWYYYLK